MINNKKKINNVKKKSGITLISLVIIVVVLLMLASIVIYINTSGGTLASKVDKESRKLEDLKKQYEKRGGKVPDTLKVNENGDIEITKGNVVSFKETTGLTIQEAVELTRD